MYSDYEGPAHLIGDTPWIVFHDLTKKIWKEDLGEWQRRWFMLEGLQVSAAH